MTDSFRLEPVVIAGRWKNKLINTMAQMCKAEQQPMKRLERTKEQSNNRTQSSLSHADKTVKRPFVMIFYWSALLLRLVMGYWTVVVFLFFDYFHNSLREPD
jgi:hypothetical protein